MLTKPVELSFDASVVPAHVLVSQFDTGWNFEFSFRMNRQPWSIPSAYTVVMNGVKPDKNVFAFSGTVSNGKAIVPCDVQMTAVAGPVFCELSLMLDGTVVGSRNFVLEVEKAPKSPDDVSSDSTLPAYAEMLEMFSGDITNAVDDWLDDHSGEIGGLTNEAKQALLTLLGHVYFDDEHGPEYIEELRSALYPPISISAVFTQGSAVIYNTDTLDTLRQYLTVTANYSGGVTEVVTAYVLSGTLTVGTSTITATYGGKSATFNVTVTKMPNGLVDGTYSVSGGGTITVSNNVMTFDGSMVNYKNYSIPFMHSIELHAGDVVTFSSKDPSTTGLNVNIGTALNTDSYYTGQYNPYSTPIKNRNKTIESDMTATHLRIQSLGSIKNTNFTFVLLVNGEEVF